MATAHVEMHAEHRQWLSDNAMWRDDIALWQQEIEQALDGVKKLEDALQQHSKELQSHLGTITAGEQALKVHEHALAEFQRGSSGKELELLVMAKTHKKKADEHVQQRQTHECLKKQHHTIMAHWSLLLNALTHKA